MSVDKDVILALDVGTTSCKGAIYRYDGTLLADSSYSYPVQRPRELWVEQNPADWWTATIHICRELTRHIEPERIAGIGLCGQVPTMLLVDKNGEPLTPAVTWQDRRAEAEASWLSENIGAEKLADWLGLDIPIDAGWPPARLLWWRRHQPEILDRANCVLLAKDYVLLKLTNRMCSDAWSAKGIAHLVSGEPHADYYAALDISPTIAPEILPPYSVAGQITLEAAELTGLREGTIVVAGWSDALCGMAGTGAFHKNEVAFNITGTSEIIGCSGRKPRPGLLQIPAALTGGIDVLYGPTQSGGDSLMWFAEWTNSGVEQILIDASEVPAQSCEVIFLPYLNGERAPIWDGSARGAFLGLLRSHTRKHGARAVMGGVAMSVRHILEACDVLPDVKRVVRLSGGGTRSALWNQIRADVLGMRVEVVAQHNAATLGAAMLAAVGANIYPNLSEAGTMTRIEEVFTPEESLREHYDQLYGRFRDAYPLLKSLHQ